MRTNYIYIQLDTISNSIISKGLNIADFDSSISNKPTNLLLLDANVIEGEFEPHTGLKIIRGVDQVSDFLTRKKDYLAQEMKWIDFKEVQFLKQLTPMEIAELLYFGHMATQLHSPFFYKLQNNFVYFEKAGQTSKVYYRYLTDFFKLVEDKVRDIVTTKVNERRGIFKRPIKVLPVHQGFLKDFKPIFQEGVVFDFSQTELENEIYTIPIYVIEDQIKKLEQGKYRNETKIAEITYNVVQDDWSLNQEDWDFLPNLKEV